MGGSLEPDNAGGFWMEEWDLKFCRLDFKFSLSCEFCIICFGVVPRRLYFMCGRFGTLWYFLIGVGNEKSYCEGTYTGKWVPV